MCQWTLISPTSNAHTKDNFSVHVNSHARYGVNNVSYTEGKKIAYIKKNPPTFDAYKNIRQILLPITICGLLSCCLYRIIHTHTRHAKANLLVRKMAKLHFSQDKNMMWGRDRAAGRKPRKRNYRYENRFIYANTGCEYDWRWHMCVCSNVSQCYLMCWMLMNVLCPRQSCISSWG